MKSKFLSLDTQDFLKGLVVAVLAVVLSSLLKILQEGRLPTLPELQTIGLTGLTAAIAYIIKNYFTNSQGQMLTKEVAPIPKP